MSLIKNRASFSPNGEYFAYLSPDGCLKIWETSSNILKQEYTPSSHLSSTCSSLVWGPTKTYSPTSKKAKKSKREDIVNALVNLQLIAMGTLTGEVLLYSITIGDLHTQLTNGHIETVNDICWNAKDDSLFTCSSDQHIIIWSLTTGKIKLKWKADKVAIYSICLIDRNNILASSSSIVWWNIKENTVLKKFSGHTTEILHLLPIKDESSANVICFLSAAVSDRIINFWKPEKENDKQPLVSFVSSDEPENIDVSLVTSPDEPLLVSVVTKSGSFHLYQHAVNRRENKPVEPKATIHIISKNNESQSKPVPVPVLAGKFTESFDSCILAYGNFIMPTFENVAIVDCPEDLYLIRNISITTGTSVEGDVSKVKVPEKSRDVKTLAPGHMAPLKPLQKSKKKVVQTDIDAKELPMEERLKALDMHKTLHDDKSKTAAKPNSMVHLLLQGLQSSDLRLLDAVLQCHDEVVIENTIKRLPLQSIKLLLTELHRRLSKKMQPKQPVLKWLLAVQMYHLPFLMSCKDISEWIGPINQLMEAKFEYSAAISESKGTLEILLKQAETVKQNNETSSVEPLVVYQSDSSDESEISEMEQSSDSEAEDDMGTSRSSSSSDSSDIELSGSDGESQNNVLIP